VQLTLWTKNSRRAAFADEHLMKLAQEAGELRRYCRQALTPRHFQIFQALTFGSLAVGGSSPRSGSHPLIRNISR